MTETPILRTNRPQWSGLHPFLYRLLIGGVLWLFAAVWLFFGHSAYTALQLGVVAVFLAMFMGVPWVMSRMGGRAPAPERHSFAEWRAGDLMTLTGPLNAGEAAIAVLLAPAAGVIGITVVSAVAYLVDVGVL